MPDWDARCRSARALVVFDFDGTLCDTREIMLQSVREVAEQNRVEKVLRLSDGDLEPFNLRRLVSMSGIPVYRLPAFVRAVRAKMLERANEMNLNGDVVTLFQGLAEVKELAVGVLTSNSAELVQRVFSRHAIEPHFVRSSLSLFSKANSLKAIRRKLDLSSLPYYVGDETRDVVAAKKSGYISVAVTWGFEEGTHLRLAAPDVLVQNHRELFSVLRTRAHTHIA